MDRVFNRWLVLSIYVSSGSILVFAHGLIGAGPLFTAAFIAGSTLTLFLFSRWSDFTIDLADLLFTMFSCSVVVSFAVNKFGSSPKEVTLLVMSLAAYPAARLFAGSKAIAPSFVLVTGMVVVLGAVLTLAALPTQWSDSYGRPHPVVFGRFGAAPAQFTLTLGFLIIALVCMRLTAIRAAAAGVLVFTLTVVFAASFVRFSFVAIGAALMFAYFTSQSHERRYAAMMMCFLISGIVVGSLARIELAPRFARPSGHVTSDGAGSSSGLVSHHAIQISVPSTEPNAKVGQACPETDMQNSIAIRKQLYSDALALLPAAGLFGIGMDRFMSLSCIRDSQVHNSILQVAVELGWVAAAMLIALLVLSVFSLSHLARQSYETRFALCGLIFVALLTMAHGRLSRDSLLFLFLGYTASIRAIRPR
ncbi:hypothetical protein I6F35_02475 [Bradyrhizobium sp. BRP22]|uniref:O-antigen ligase family protein n=1 Tax=Bradyrhizobium sp. BRP22 TaxID=2793821 RepID=UPI001CD213B6|nr:O-antigen ligase family protein [Bradyrhizobium sp. BRP22]MCA1452080.1 hypothetical protein [Bradyrhizobium sp. BRP22]